MTAQSKPYPAVEILLDTFAAWLKHRRELNEMRQMDRSDFDRIASDLRVSPGELDTLVRQGPHAADELPKLLRALGIDQADLVRTEPLVLRDMERVCTLCHHKRQCDRDLAAGTSAEQYEGYCPNAPTIDGLGQTPERFG
jgi:transcriptional regulator with XRE-family HTH domain